MIWPSALPVQVEWPGTTTDPEAPRYWPRPGRPPDLTAAHLAARSAAGRNPTMCLVLLPPRRLVPECWSAVCIIVARSALLHGTDELPHCPVNCAPMSRKLGRKWICGPFHRQLDCDGISGALGPRQTLPPIGRHWRQLLRAAITTLATAGDAVRTQPTAGRIVPPPCTRSAADRATEVDYALPPLGQPGRLVGVPRPTDDGTNFVD